METMVGKGDGSLRQGRGQAGGEKESDFGYLQKCKPAGFPEKIVYGV